MCVCILRASQFVVLSEVLSPVSGCRKKLEIFICYMARKKQRAKRITKIKDHARLYFSKARV